MAAALPAEAPLKPGAALAADMSAHATLLALGAAGSGAAAPRRAFLAVAPLSREDVEADERASAGAHWDAPRAGQPRSEADEKLHEAAEALKRAEAEARSGVLGPAAQASAAQLRPLMAMMEGVRSAVTNVEDQAEDIERELEETRTVMAAIDAEHARARRAYMAEVLRQLGRVEEAANAGEAEPDATRGLVEALEERLEREKGALGADAQPGAEPAAE